MKRWPPSNKRPISSFQPPSSPPLPSLSFLARALQHARIRDRDLFILTKITRGPARRVIDRATLCRFILPLPLRLLSLLPSPSCSFSPTCPRLPPRPSIIIPLKPTFHASPLSFSPRYRFPIKTFGEFFAAFKGASSVGAHGLPTVVPEF